MIDRLRSLAVFTTVAEAGSFRAAAKRLELAPSVVSHHVTALENASGVTLFYRSTRKLTLTAAGENLLRHGHIMLKAAREGLDGLYQYAGNPSGKLRITVPAILQDGKFADDVARFMAFNPQVNLAIDFSDIRQPLVDGGYDLALRIGALEDSAFKSKRIIGGSQILCASPKFLRRYDVAKSPEDLSKLDFITYADMPDSINIQSGSSRKQITLQRKLTVDTGHAAKAFVLRHVGVALLPRFFVAKHLEAGELVTVLPDWKMEDFSIHAIWPEAAGANSLARLFVDFLVSHLQADPPLLRTR
jgi:DNA-binding transcriptional LysR family regulator